MRNVCLAHDIFQRNPNYTLVLLPCPVGKPWLCVCLSTMSKEPILVMCVRAHARTHTHTHTHTHARARVCVCVSKKPVLNLVTKWPYLFICLQHLQSEPLICVWCFCKVDHQYAHIHVWRVLVISATHALFTYGHEMPVQSFWYHFGTLGTIYDLLYSNYAITLLLYQPSDARINCLEECSDCCWDLSFSCIVLPTHSPPHKKGIS